MKGETTATGYFCFLDSLTHMCTCLQPFIVDDIETGKYWATDTVPDVLYGIGIPLLVGWCGGSLVAIGLGVQLIRCSL